MSLHDRYFDWSTEYAKKYDSAKTVVLMMVGSFYEMYSIKNETETVGADLFTICDLLGIQLTRKNKAILENSRSNPMMAGFPVGVMDKHVQTLLGAGYTIVMVDQITPPPNPQREVTQVISPSMTLTPSGKDGTYLMVVYMDCVDKALKTGFALCDATTGQTFVYEAHSTSTDVNFAQDEMARLISTYAPKEVVYVATSAAGAAGASGGGIDGISNNHRRFNIDKAYEKPAFQNLILQKAHPVQTSSILTPIEALNLERHGIATVAYCYMIDFIREHNDKLSTKLAPPEFIDNERHMTLQYISTTQLNIIGGEKPLMSILNRCSTAFGARLFKQRLLAPLILPAAINERLDAVEKMLTDNSHPSIRKHLAEVLDLERTRRKIALGTFLPAEWNGLDMSLANSLKVVVAQAFRDHIEAVMQGYTKVLNIATAASKSIFLPGIYPDIDEVEQSIEASLKQLDAIANRFGADIAKVEQNDRDGYFITITKKRYTEYLKQSENKNKQKETLTAKPISSTSSVLRVSSPEIEQLSNSLIVAQRLLGVLCSEKYREFIKTFDAAHGATLGIITAHIAEIDVAATCAFNAVSYGYTRPVIKESAQSAFEAIEIRHPIIERLNSGIEYTTNNIALGASGSYGTSGMLLFGINAVGKSSLMKSVGLNIVMAQAGMYVACRELTLTPYHSLFTRIPDGDNIYRGQSTFTVEMTELRNILQRCDGHSLVLGDELCSGTEAVSAISIVAAGITHLVKKASTFIFATHLHDLVNEAIVSLPQQVRVCHMHIDIDPETSKIVYHRKLREGSGSSLYGLEVCRAIGLPSEFIEEANEVRKKLQANTLHLKPKKSRYNAGVYIDMCGVCKVNRATETHHIKYQCEADEAGFVEGAVRKNDASNLVPLCEACHQKEHSGIISIKGFIKTSSGRDLFVEGC